MLFMGWGVPGMNSLIDRYLTRLIFTPFAATLAIFTMLLLLVRMAELLDFVVAEGGSMTTMLQVLVCLAPQYLAMALPIGLLAGVALDHPFHETRDFTRGLSLERFVGHTVAPCGQCL